MNLSFESLGLSESRIQQLEKNWIHYTNKYTSTGNPPIISRA